MRQVAFDERRKIHDLLMEGVELALKKRALGRQNVSSRGRLDLPPSQLCTGRTLRYVAD